MTDEKYLFVSDVKDKKRTARGSRNKSRGAAHRTVRMPSDYLTEKERKSLNGEVVSYNLKQPMKWAAYKALPDDIQREYILNGVVQKAADYLIAHGVTVVTDNDVGGKWVSVSERMPEDDKRNRFYDDGTLIFTTVLGYDKEGGIRFVNRINVKPCGIDYIDRLATEGWRWSYRAEAVTHWMPLPAAPKEVER